MKTKADPLLAQLAVIAQGIYRKQAEITALAELLDMTIDSLAQQRGLDLAGVLNPNRANRKANGSRARKGRSNVTRAIPRGAKRSQP